MEDPKEERGNMRDYVSCLGGECLGVAPDELEEVGQEREV